MDRLTLIENKIADAVKTINGGVQPSGYTYYTSAGTVNIEDECLSLSQNTDENMVNYLITLNGSETQTSFTYGQNAYMNSVNFLITGKVHNVGDEGNPT